MCFQRSFLREDTVTFILHALDRPVALEGLEGLLEALPKSLDPITKYIMDLFRKWAWFDKRLLRDRVTKNYILNDEIVQNLSELW